VFRRQRYGRISYNEVDRRLLILRQFRDELERYYAARTWTPTRRLVEPGEAKPLRESLNQKQDETSRVLGLAGISATVTYHNPQTGLLAPIQLVPNFPRLWEYDIESSALFDQIDRAIGIYQTERPHAVRRTWNPFFWIGLLLDWVSRLPFSIARRAGIQGLNEETKAASVVRSAIWIVGALGMLITALDAIVNLLQAFDVWEAIRAFVSGRGLEPPQPR
jgi:hypothetical protein